MLHPVLMLISFSCFVYASCYFIMAQHIAFKFNRIKLNLNNCWLSHGATISKLTSATTLTFYGKVLIGSIVVHLAGASHEGRLWACLP